MIQNTIDCILEKSKSVAFTGHRVLKDNFDSKKLKKLLKKLIENGFNTFYVGMALGFDTECFKQLALLRKKHDIKIIACIPCLNQAERFSILQKKEYEKQVKSADYKVVLYSEYNDKCMQERNMFMVDNASQVISYMYKNSGGTYNTVKYANKIGVPVYNVNHIFEEDL